MAAGATLYLRGGPSPALTWTHRVMKPCINHHALRIFRRGLVVRRLFGIGAAVWMLVPIVGLADVIVIANRTSTTVEWRVVGGSAPAGQFRLEAGDLATIPASGPLSIAVRDGRRNDAVVTHLDADCCYYFGQTRSGKVQLAKIGLGDGDASDSARGLGANQALGTIRVKLLVDDDEPARRPVWERRLLRRMSAASSILEKFCRLRLNVVSVGTWTTDNATQDFSRTLTEFERTVRTESADVAIGFTSQYDIPRSRMHLGGTRGPLHSHILIREWSQHIPEPQRVELLLHEIGHYLGAVHSPEPASIMRAVLISKRTRNARFPIQYDPVNTLIMYMVGEELRSRKVDRFSALTPATQRRLRQIYRELAKISPRDSSADSYLRMLQAGRAARDRGK